ncbi:LON peptidase substrate-binding domain-containing protein [Thiocystis violacea]|uniref:LON peptidase substrate-binding domain-containing protein n=1 Tax=Thiocystis violacea TaxID=13725 RepID=UPI001906A3EC|nr:LON peptidase substrate-binding domain-containing protein [Thiocystis violacea]MBK1720945.1 peptidase S16 [Thiocystis violacea]
MTRNPFFPKFSDLPREIPIFPLAGAVVMPGVQLPLNIFEPRYINMVFDACASTHLLGMIQPTSETMTQDRPEIHRVGCAGRITSYSETNDGRIILVLTGVCRFQVSRELEERKGYRCASIDWERFAADYHMEGEGMADREGFLGSLKTYCNLRGVEIPWDDIEKMGDNELTNLLCAHLPLSPEDKQALIETLQTVERAALMRGLLDMASASSMRVAEHRH